MSYILQALAQSERERRDADATDLEHVFDVDTPTETGQRRKKLIFTVLLVNVTVIAALILLGDFQFGDKANTSTAAATDNTPIAAPGSERIPTAQQQASLIRQPPQPINAAPATPKSNIPIYNPPANDVATPKHTTIRSTSPETQAVTDINKAATQDIPIEEPSVTEIPIVEPKAKVNKPTQLARQQSAEKLDLTGIEHVSTLPGIDMAVHAYSDKTAERFVFINGQEYHEGDTISAGGAKLEAITVEGIIVNFGDRRVLLSRIR